MKARKGVTIIYPVKLKGRQIVDHIPPDRNAVLVWQDQFGSVHAVGFGDIDTQDPRFEKVVQKVAKTFKLFGRAEP
jgi:hypothetical protein